MTSVPPVQPGPRVETDPLSRDPRLAGRTYAVPFDDVWSAALRIAGGGAARWSLVRADDEEGVIDAERRTLLLRTGDLVRIDVGLDRNGQTRVDLTWTTRSRRPSLGRGTRVLGWFVRRLDRELDVSPDLILDARRTPSWNA